MKNILLARKADTALVLAIALLSLTGCSVFQQHVREDEEIGMDRVRTIRCGETTREDIVTALGPPIAIARKAKSTSYLAPRTSTVRYGLRDSAPFLELFSKNGALGGSDAVYYYRATVRDTDQFLLILILINVGGRGNSLQTEHLWLLVDEQSGIVKDVEYRDAEHHRAGCANAPAADRRE